jgi:hypothetical protein
MSVPNPQMISFFAITTLLFGAGIDNAALPARAILASLDSRRFKLPDPIENDYGSTHDITAIGADGYTDIAGALIGGEKDGGSSVLRLARASDRPVR